MWFAVVVSGVNRSSCHPRRSVRSRSGASVSKTSGGRTLVFAFDDEGTVLGRIEGERVDATQVLSSKDSLVTVTSESVTVLTDQGRTDIPIDEHTISAMSHDPATGAEAQVRADALERVVRIGQVQRGGIGLELRRVRLHDQGDITSYGSSRPSVQDVHT